MVTLPDYTSLGSARVESAGEPTPQYTPLHGSYDNAGAPGAALSSYGDQLQKTSSDLQDVINVAQVNDAMANNFQPKVRELGSEFYQLQGKAAMNGAQPYATSVTQAMNDTAQTLSGEAQRNFLRMAQSTVDTEQYRASMHAGQQALVYSNQSFEAAQLNTVHDYSSQILTDPNTAEVTKAHAFTQLNGHLDQMGIPANDPLRTYYQNTLNDTLDKAHQGAIQQTLQSMPGATQQALLRPLYASQSGNLPQDMGGDTVKPYTATQVANIQAQVAKPSPYDALFQQYGQQYGIDPNELKLHAAAESSMNPKADNGQSQGLMQLSNANVKALGITDPFDPAQSIEGAAKLMQQNGAKDTHSADLMYYGGPNASQQGPNSQQYAENLAAVRGNGGNPPTPGQPNPQIPSWLQDVAPSTIPKLTEMANATAAHEATLLSDKNSAALEQAKKDVIGKYANGTLTAQDTANPIFPAEYQKELLDMVSKQDKVNPNDSDVIKTRGQMTLMPVDDPIGFKQMDLSTLVGKLPATEIGQLYTQQAALKKGDESLEGQNKQAKNIIDSVSSMLPLSWQKPKDQPTENQANAFKGNLIGMVRDIQTNGGKMMSDTDIKKLASNLLGSTYGSGQDVTVKGAGTFGTDKTYAPGLLPDNTDLRSMYVGSEDNMYIPESYKMAVSNAYEKLHGVPPTDAMIASQYKVWLGTNK